MQKQKRELRIGIGESDKFPEGYSFAYAENDWSTLVCYPKPLNFIIEHFAMEKGYKGASTDNTHFSSRYCPVCNMGEEYKDFMRKFEKCSEVLWKKQLDDWEKEHPSEKNITKDHEGVK